MPLALPANPLRPRQREMLEWIATVKPCRMWLVLTGPVCRYRRENTLRGARDALDVDTTAQAIARAALWGNLFLLWLRTKTCPDPPPQ